MQKIAFTFILFFYMLGNLNAQEKGNKEFYLYGGSGLLIDDFSFYDPKEDNMIIGPSVWFSFGVKTNEGYILESTFAWGTTYQTETGNYNNESHFEGNIIARNYQFIQLGFAKPINIKNSTLQIGAGIAYLGCKTGQAYISLPQVNNGNTYYISPDYIYNNLDEIGIYFNLSYLRYINKQVFYGIRFEGNSSIFVGPITFLISPVIGIKIGKLKDKIE